MHAFVCGAGLQRVRGPVFFMYPPRVSPSPPFDGTPQAEVIPAVQQLLASKHMKRDINRLTVRTWQSRSPRPLTSEDAREIISNVTGFFRVLAEWDRAEKATPDDKGGS